MLCSRAVNGSAARSRLVRKQRWGKNNQQLAEDAEHLPALRRLVLNALNRNLLFFAAALPLKILPPFFNRYAGISNINGPHVDSAMRPIQNGAGTSMRSDISATLFLSDPNRMKAAY